MSPGRYLELHRRDGYLAAALLGVAFVLRFFSPLMPDVFAQPLSGGLVSNCVHSTPIDAQGDLGTLCGLAYPYQRGYSAQSGAPLQPANGQIFDEVYFPVFAHDDLKGIAYFDPEPPLSKEFIAAGEWLWGWWKATFLGYRGDYADLGFDTFGFRIAACLAGSLCPPMMYLLARKLYPDPFFALAAGVLTCFDGMFFVQSRIGMIDIFPIFLILLTYFVFLVHWRSRTRAESLVSLFLLGACVGLAVAAKWIALAALATIGLFLLARFARAHVDLRVGSWQWGKGEGPSIPGGVAFATYLPAALVALLVLPAAIYVVSWFPFFLRGQFHTLGDLWHYQVQSYVYHATLTATHPYGSKWYTWPLLYRPVAYYFENQGLGFDQATHQPLVAWMVNLGNPWIWWTSLPCVLITVWLTFRDRSFPAALIALGFAAQWLPWSRITRVLFLYHMFGALIFMVLALAFVLTGIARSGRGGRYVAYGHLVLAVLFFAYFYPLWTGLPMTGHALLSGFPAGKAWFPSWI